MANDKKAKLMIVLALAGAASVGVAYALKKKAPSEEFNIQINDVFEYI